MTPHTQAAFVTSFVDREGRQPTPQEVWDAAIRSYRDLARPASAPAVQAPAEAHGDLTDELVEQAIEAWFTYESGEQDNHPARMRNALRVALGANVQPKGTAAPHVGDTRFEGWLSEHEISDVRGSKLPRHHKQDMRDAYWAGYCERTLLPEHADHVAEIAVRLRRLGRVAGVADCIPEDDATAVGAIFTVLGSMAGAMERAGQAPAPAPEVPHGPRTEFVLNELRSAINVMLTFFGMDEDENNKEVFDKARQAYDYAQIVMRPLAPWERQSLEDFRACVHRWHEKACAKGYDGVESMCDTALPYGTRDLRLVSPSPAVEAAPQPEAHLVQAGSVLVKAEELTEWKSLVNSLAVLSLKSERVTTAIILKSLIQDAIDAAPSAQPEAQQP